MNEELLKGLTVDQLKKDRPDLFGALCYEAQKDERARIVSIVKYANELAIKVGMEPLLPVVLKAINENLSLNNFTNEVYAVVEETLANSKPKNNAADSKKLPHLDRARIFQRTHGCGIIDALRATAEPRG
ncbi:MAG: hypothetical protein NTW06_01375 [Candidatus Falkowbacteria bacterium]|nr:hypothetical protein [Candidatus Falkowbacteria bacterium]